MRNLNTITLDCICYLLPTLFSLMLLTSTKSYSQNQNFVIDETFPYHINSTTLNRTPIGGDTLFIASTRTLPLRFQQIEGNAQAPIVVINQGGQVKIDDLNTWGAITFENSKFIKISGNGHPGYKYGFELSASQSGLAFVELSSDCEAEFIKISHNGFFGIMAKKDYNGNPPSPYPIFENLKIHDCFIENVSEGMYLGETKSPGMEFKHVKIYNNIVRNTLRESIQIANMVEDVEIYNNTLLNAGLENMAFHTNILQIGDNSVANVYNNILSEAPEFGIINMGKGNCSFTNNYIASSQGIFCDNRTISDSLAPINIKDNYFRTTNNTQIVRNMNEINYLTVEDNYYDTNVPFFYNQTNNTSNYIVNNNTLTTVNEILFTDPANNNYSLAQNTPSTYLNMGAPSGPEFFEYDDPATTPKQLIITPKMVTDSVPGGSILSPLFLFDEQNINIEANEHATSDSWKPDFMMNQSSYHIIVDLEDEHYISEISLHDMNATHNFTAEYYDGSIWTNLFVEPCDSFNTWKTHTTDVSTRYLRFSMYDSPYAAVNEIIIQGYPILKEHEQIIITSDLVTDMVNGGSVNSPLFLFDEQNLDIDANEHAISNSWKPFYTNANAPYYAMIDLGQDYHISEINMHDMNGTYDFVVEYGNGPDWVELFTEPCIAYNVWKTHDTSIATRYLRLKMPDSPYAAINEITISGYPIMTLPGTNIVPNNSEPEAQQIIITSTMISDLVSGGSVNSPQFLFDEQNVDITINEHPTSNSWKPFYTNANAPYYTTIDFGEEYHISKVYLHDMNGTYNFEIEYDNSGNWATLFTETCDAFNVWKLHDTNIETQHLRLGMLDSPYAAVNEIIIYGHPTANSQKPSNAKSKTQDQGFSSDKIELYQNPVDQNLRMKLPKTLEGNNTILIKDILGKTIFNKNIVAKSKDYLIELNISQTKIASGYYFVLCQHESGQFETVKFYKK